MARRTSTTKPKPPQDTEPEATPTVTDEQPAAPAVEDSPESEQEPEDTPPDDGDNGDGGTAAEGDGLDTTEDGADPDEGAPTTDPGLATYDSAGRPLINDDGTVTAPEATTDPDAAVPGAPLEAPKPRDRNGVEVNQGVPEFVPGDEGAARAAASERDPSKRIIDSETGEAPDPDTLFEKRGIGTTRVCTRRITMITVHPSGSVTRQLLLPAGTSVSAAAAEQMAASIRAQDD